MGGDDDPQSSSLSSLLTYGANSDEETVGQPNSAPNVKSDASAPNASASHVAAVTPGQPPTQASQAPTYNPPDMSGLATAQGQLNKDMQPVTVKPKWWERLAGGLSAGAMAFDHMPDALEAGRSVTNRGQNASDAVQTKKIAADRSAIQAWQDGQKQQQQDFQNKNTAYRSQQEGARTDSLNSDRAAQESQRNQAVAPGSETPDDPKNPLGTWHATTVDGKPITLQGPPDKWAKSPAGVAAQRDADVERLKLTGDDAKFYRANGKLKEPGAVTNVHVPSEGQQAYNDALSAWRTDNPGKKPTLSDLRTIRSAADGKAEVLGGPKRGTAGQFSTLDKETATQYAKAEAAYNSATDNGKMGDADKAEALATLNAEKARIGGEHSQRLRDLGGAPAEDSQSGTQSGKPPAPPKKGDVVKGYRFNGGDPSDKANWKKV